MKLYNFSTAKLYKTDHKKIKIAVYGLGKMGLPLAAVFANHGFQVIGVDLNKKTVKAINNGENPVLEEKGLSSIVQRVTKKGLLKATTYGIQASKDSDIKMIIVPTYLDNQNNPDLTIVKDVIEKIAKGLQKGDIVILESTAPPGTTNMIGKTLEKLSGLTLNKDFGVAHCPERISSGTAIEDIEGRLCPKVVGGSDKKTTQIAAFIYSKINKLGVITVENPTVAELIKLSEEIYRDVNIAYANNLYLMCRELGVDALEVIKVSNTNPYCNILSPGPGVGGHCIPVYPYFMFNTTKSNHELLKLARRINDSMSTHVIHLAKDALKTKSIQLASANILVLGLAYRAGVKETRKSPGLKIAHELGNITGNVYVYDPLFTEEETKKFGLKYKKDFSNIDSIIITTDEAEFKKLDWGKIGKQVHTKTIVDTKNIVDLESLSNLGFVVRRVGYAE